MKKKIGIELGWFFIKLIISLLLLPFWVNWLNIRSSSDGLHQLETYFLIELGVLWLLISLLALYIIRFILSLIWKKMGGGAAKTP